MKLNHIAIPGLAILAFMFGGILNSGGIAWYHTLTLPSWSPDAGLVAFIWALIYVLAAWSLLVFWNKTPHDKHFWFGIFGFAGVTLINLLWSVVFFHLHLLHIASWAAFLLSISVLILCVFLYGRSKKAALLLAPYIVWVLFATYLSSVVSVLNGG